MELQFYFYTIFGVFHYSDIFFQQMFLCFSTLVQRLGIANHLTKIFVYMCIFDQIDIGSLDRRQLTLSCQLFVYRLCRSCEYRSNYSATIFELDMLQYREDVLHRCPHQLLLCSNGSQEICVLYVLLERQRHEKGYYFLPDQKQLEL